MDSTVSISPKAKAIAIINKFIKETDWQAFWDKVVGRGRSPE